MTKNAERISPPGETIEDLLEERGWTLEMFAEHLGCRPEFIEKLIKGEIHITNEMATELSKTLGSTETFWLNRERQYREKLREWAYVVSVKDLVDGLHITGISYDENGHPALITLSSKIPGEAEPWERVGIHQIPFDELEFVSADPKTGSCIWTRKKPQEMSSYGIYPEGYKEDGSPPTETYHVPHVAYTTEGDEELIVHVDRFKGQASKPYFGKERPLVFIFDQGYLALTIIYPSGKFEVKGDAVRLV